MQEETLHDTVLLPCPFCGFVPIAYDADCIYPEGRSRIWWNIHCYETGGGCGLALPGDGVADCITKWNTRK